MHKRNFDSQHLDASLSIEHYAIAIVRIYFKKVCTHEQECLIAHQQNSIHHMRVALRHLLCAIKILGPYLPKDIVQFDSFFRQLNHTLGTIRDLDVHITSLKKLEASMPQKGLYELREYFEVTRENSYTKFLALITTKKHLKTISKIEKNIAHATFHETLNVLDCAATLMQKTAYKLQKNIEKLTPESPIEYFHKARIKAKRLRYCLEFFAQIYKNKLGEQQNILLILQNHLGALNDTTTIQQQLIKLQSLPQMSSSEALHIIPIVLVHYASIAEQNRKTFLAFTRSLDWKTFGSTLVHERLNNPGGFDSN